jgi:bacterial leucyl aminopeptidase
MRSALVVLVVVGCASPPPESPSAETGTRYITIGADAIGVASDVAGAGRTGSSIDILEATDEVAIVAIEAEDLDALAEQMHEEHHRCGGFMLHESLDDARAAMRPQLDAGDRVDYKLDRAAAVETVLPTLERAQILATIEHLSGMQNRYYRSTTGAAASTWLRDLWRGFTDRSDVTVELFDQGYPQQSVILTIPGSTLASQVVVLGGHLDSIARGGNASIAPGADDDASGIATLTEVVRALLAHDYRPARTVKIMAYAAEEVGLRGSQAIVRDFKKRNVDVVGALQLDMTNYQGSERDIWLIKDHTSAPQNAFLIQLIETYVGATWGLDACGYACSDHASWHRAGVPASMPFESRFRDSNRSIHTADDTLERSEHNVAHALKFARLATAYAIELGKGELGKPATTIAAAGEPVGPCSGPWQLPVLALLAAAGLWLQRRAVA